jgi:hypothetical protein
VLLGETIKGVVGPEINDHKPVVPETGALAVSDKGLKTQFVKSRPALAEFGNTELKITTVSIELQLPLELVIVQTIVVGVPGTKPVMPELFEDGFVNTPEPEMIDQRPVPTIGLFPDKSEEFALQRF